MARRKLIYTDYYPFHITARTLGKDWYGLSKKKVWSIFKKRLEHLAIEYKFKIHAFVLMSNHYHLVASADPRFDLEYLIQRLQGGVSLEINKALELSFYVFEEPTKSSQITTPTYYKRVLKYVYRNPVEAGISARVEDYKFSTLNRSDLETVFPYNIDYHVNYRKLKMLPWLNDENCPEWSRLEVYRDLMSRDFQPLFNKIH
jgi:REP element-mobilizing transposase RayT